MPEYHYTALTRQGVEVSGSEQADSVEALTRQLKKQQITLLKSRERKKKAIPFAVIQAFLAELSPLASNGIPIDRALQIVGEDSIDPRIGELAAQLRQGIKRGESLSQALSQSGRFDTLLVALVKVGETSGELPRILAILETYYQESRQTRRDLVAALSYPAILAVISLLSIIGLALFVVPVFRDIFDERAQDALPLGTKILFAGSEFLIQYGAVLVVALTALGIGAALFFQHHDGANRLWHRFLLNAPVIGQIRSRFEGFKLAKALSIMIERGVPLVQAAEIAQPLLANRIQREGFAACAQALRKGEPIPQAIARIPGLPVQFHRYIKLGNETVALVQNLGKAADLLRDDFKNRLKSLIAILDPLIIVTMGGGVAFMVISILLAVFSLSDVH